MCASCVVTYPGRACTRACGRHDCLLAKAEPTRKDRSSHHFLNFAKHWCCRLIQSGVLTLVSKNDTLSLYKAYFHCMKTICVVRLLGNIPTQGEIPQGPWKSNPRHASHGLPGSMSAGRNDLIIRQDMNSESKETLSTSNAGTPISYCPMMRRIVPLPHFRIWDSFFL